MKNEQEQTPRHEQTVQTNRQINLAHRLGSLIFEMLFQLRTLANLAVGLEGVWSRLSKVTPRNQISNEELYVAKALLTAFCHETERLQTDAKDVEELFAAVLSAKRRNCFVPTSRRQKNVRSHAARLVPPR
jgi:hypothetical protein